MEKKNKGKNQPPKEKKIKQVKKEWMINIQIYQK